MSEINNSFKNINLFDDIRSKYVLKQIFNNIKKYKRLKIIKYNKNIKERLNIGIKDYKSYSEIEIELFPIEKIGTKKIKFINISKEIDESYYHFYFYDSRKLETKKTYFDKYDRTKKIRIILDYEFNSFKGLFEGCTGIEKINFKKCNRKDITDLSYLLSKHQSVKIINFTNFNTANVINMSYMFYNCPSLKEINLSNLNTINVTNMSYMFYNCLWLKILNLSNLNTINVNNMSYMFYNCSSLKELYLFDFNTINVKVMSYMFCDCSSLKELGISNFNTKNVINMS